MKRILVGILTVCIFVCALPLYASATEATVFADISDTSPSTGDSITVQVILSGNPGLCSVEFVLKYDNTKLSCTGITTQSVLKSTMAVSNPTYAGGAKVAAISTSPVTEDGVLAEFTFLVRDNDAVSGLEITGLVICGADGKALPVQVTAIQDAPGGSEKPDGSSQGGGSETARPDAGAPPTEDAATQITFSDIKRTDYFYQAVMWASNKKVTTGITPTTFCPKWTCTRAQTVTFLWRTMGSPEPAGKTCPFTDVDASAYYYKAVLWAVANGLTKGTTDTTFSPNAAITRAEVVTLLWRAKGSEAVTATNPFKDVPPRSYFSDAVIWAARARITDGTSATTFSPWNPCTRAQVVTFLFRFVGQ